LNGGDDDCGVGGCAPNFGAVVNECPTGAAEFDTVLDEDADCFDCARFGFRVRGGGSGRPAIAALMLLSLVLTAYSRILRSILRMSAMPVSLGVSGLKKA